MPTELFNELKIDKKMKIIHVGIAEFAQHGYINSSTNRIVKNAGISKGSLFKYFRSKEELYFYILDSITEELMTDLNEKTGSLPKDLFERVIKYSELEFSWYIQNPDKYKIIIQAFTKDDTEIYHKIEARYPLIEQDIYYSLLEDIDIKPLKWGKQQTADLLKWILKGFKEEFINKTDLQNNKNLDNIQTGYIKSLTEYLEMIQTGLML